MRDIDDTQTELMVMVARMDVRLDTQLPDLATKAEIADLRAAPAETPGTTYRCGVLGVLLTAYACGLAALAILK